MIQLEIGEGKDLTHLLHSKTTFLLLIHILPYITVSYSYTQQTQHLPMPHTRAGEHQ